MTTDHTLDAATGMDAVTLRVGDLENMSGYYSAALGLAPIEERTRGGEVHRVLGRGEIPLVRLVHTPDLPPVNPRDAGLFHTAFLFDTAADLAATVYTAAQDSRTRFTGSADHVVSEAFYFTDPEGNGIELYTDRPRETWQKVNGQLHMDTLPLDPNTYLRTHLTEQHLNNLASTPGRVGHVHLQVGDIPRAQDYYVNVLGFEATLSGYPGALFASAGGYHHHVGMNTWQSRGAGPRAARLGLGDLAITVPTRDDLDALIARMHTRGIQAQDLGWAVRSRDPWGTEVTVAVAGSTTEQLLGA
ncbi:VOC family protein [Microbacterium sediminicola]|uniref:VOC family protein n=1 Tax=Microbacterium sediminicola TaxID=415210 RepID=A0ABP4TZL9_9MICO